MARRGCHLLGVPEAGEVGFANEAIHIGGSYIADFPLHIIGRCYSRKHKRDAQCQKNRDAHRNGRCIAILLF
jgi:hypothetical protein